MTGSPIFLCKFFLCKTGLSPSTMHNHIRYSNVLGDWVIQMYYLMKVALQKIFQGQPTWCPLQRQQIEISIFFSPDTHRTSKITGSPHQIRWLSPSSNAIRRVSRGASRADSGKSQSQRRNHSAIVLHKNSNRFSTFSSLSSTKAPAGFKLWLCKS